MANSNLHSQEKERQRPSEAFRAGERTTLREGKERTEDGKTKPADTEDEDESTNVEKKCEAAFSC